MRVKLLIVAAMLSLSACMSVGTKVESSKAAEFVKGVTTYNEVIASLGTPQTVGTQSDGRKILGYAYSSASPNAASFIPFVGIFAGKTKSEVNVVSFVFTSDDKLESYTSTQSSSTYQFGSVK